MGDFPSSPKAMPGKPMRPAPGEIAGKATVTSSRLYHVDDGTEYVGEGEIGVSGMLNRVIEVSSSCFKSSVRIAIQQDMKAGLASTGSWWTRSGRSIIGLPMISPTSRFAWSWMIFITLMDLTYAAFWVPMNVAFCSVRYGDLDSPCTIADLAGGVLYAIHLLLNFHVGMVLTHEYKKKVIMDGGSVAALYIRYGRFWLDFVSMLPFVYLLAVIVNELSATRWVAIMSLFRLVRMGRLVSLVRTVYMDAQRGEESSSFIKKVGGSVTAYIIIGTVGLATVVNLEACLLVLVAEFMGTENSWMSSLDWVDIARAPVIHQWYAGVFVAIASNTNTGLAGVGFHNQGEMAVCMIMQMVGMIMFTMITTIGLMFMTKVTAYGMSMYHLGTKLKRVRAFLDVHQLPDHICKAMLTFYFEDWVARSGAVIEDAVVADMPGSLRASLLLPVTLDLVKSCHFLSDCSPDLQALVAQALIPVEMMPGVELCQEGQPADCCWVLQQGTVRANNLQGVRCTLEGPCLLGESMIISREVHGCRERLWTYQVLTGAAPGCPAKLWRLTNRDVQMISRATGDFSSSLLLYIQGKLGYSMVPGIQRNAFPGADDRWCELTSSILSSLARHSRKVFNDARFQLTQVSLEDSSLAVLLDALLQVSTLNHNDAAVLGQGLTVPDTVVATKRDMLTRRSVQVMLTSLPPGGLTGFENMPLYNQLSSQWLLSQASHAPALSTHASKLPPQLSKFSTAQATGCMMSGGGVTAPQHSPTSVASHRQPANQLQDISLPPLMPTRSDEVKRGAGLDTASDVEQGSLFSTLLRVSTSHFTAPVTRSKHATTEAGVKSSIPAVPSNNSTTSPSRLQPPRPQPAAASHLRCVTGHGAQAASIVNASQTVRHTLQVLAGSSLAQPSAPIFSFVPWGQARLPPPAWVPRPAQDPDVKPIPPAREVTFGIVRTDSSGPAVKTQTLGDKSLNSSDFSLAAPPAQTGFSPSAFSAPGCQVEPHKSSKKFDTLATEDLSRLLLSHPSLGGSDAEENPRSRSSRVSRASGEQARQRSMLRQTSRNPKERVSRVSMQGRSLWQPSSVRNQRNATLGGDHLLQSMLASLLLEDEMVQVHKRTNQGCVPRKSMIGQQRKPSKASAELAVVASPTPPARLSASSTSRAELPAAAAADDDEAGAPGTSQRGLDSAAKVPSHPIGHPSVSGTTSKSTTGQSLTVSPLACDRGYLPMDGAVPVPGTMLDTKQNGEDAGGTAAPSLLSTAASGEFSIPMPPNSRRRRRAHRSCEFLDSEDIQVLERSIAKSGGLARSLCGGALPERKSIRIAEHPEILGEAPRRGLWTERSSTSYAGTDEGSVLSRGRLMMKGTLSRAASVEGLAALKGSGTSSRKLSRAVSALPERRSNLGVRNEESGVSGNQSPSRPASSTLSKVQGCVTCDATLLDEGPPCSMCGAGYCWDCGGMLVLES